MPRKTIEIPTPDEVAQMTTADLRKLVTRLNSAANKRLKRLEKSGLKEESWAYNAVKNKLINDRFSVKGAKTRKQLINRLKNVSTFIGYTTSTVSGARSELLRITKLFGGRTDNEEMRRIAKIVNEIRKLAPSLFHIVGSERMYRYVSEQLDEFNNMDIEDITSNAIEYMNKVYEARRYPNYKRGTRI